MDVSKRVMQGRSRTEQQRVVREVLLSMLPPGAPAQVSFFLSIPGPGAHHFSILLYIIRVHNGTY